MVSYFSVLSYKNISKGFYDSTKLTHKCFVRNKVSKSMFLTNFIYYSMNGRPISYQMNFLLDDFTFKVLSSVKNNCLHTPLTRLGLACSSQENSSPREFSHDGQVLKGVALFEKPHQETVNQSFNRRTCNPSKQTRQLPSDSNINIPSSLTEKSKRNSKGKKRAQDDFLQLLKVF